MEGIGIELAANRLMCDEQKASRIKSSGHRMWRGTTQYHHPFRFVPDAASFWRALRFYDACQDDGAYRTFS